LSSRTPGTSPSFTASEGRFSASSSIPTSRALRPPTRWHPPPSAPKRDAFPTPPVPWPVPATGTLQKSPPALPRPPTEDPPGVSSSAARLNEDREDQFFSTTGPSPNAAARPPAAASQVPWHDLPRPPPPGLGTKRTARGREPWHICGPPASHRDDERPPRSPARQARRSSSPVETPSGLGRPSAPLLQAPVPADRPQTVAPRPVTPFHFIVVQFFACSFSRRFSMPSPPAPAPPPTGDQAFAVSLTAGPTGRELIDECPPCRSWDPKRENPARSPPASSTVPAGRLVVFPGAVRHRTRPAE